MNNEEYSTDFDSIHKYDTTNTIFKSGTVDGDVRGTMLFDAYGISTMANSTAHNCDNVFMNGMYMKSFSFSHYEKYVNTDSDSGLFILCTGDEKSSGFPKEFLSKVANKMPEIKSHTEKRALGIIAGIAAELNTVYQGKPEETSNIAIIFIRGLKAYISVFGNIRVIGIKKGIPYIIEQGNNNKIGTPEFNAFNISGAKPKKINQETKYIMKNQGVAKYISDEQMCEKVEANGMRDGIASMIERATSFNFDDTLTAIGIRVQPTRIALARKKKQMILVGTIAAALAAFAVILGILL